MSLFAPKGTPAQPVSTGFLGATGGLLGGQNQQLQQQQQQQQQQQAAQNAQSTGLFANAAQTAKPFGNSLFGQSATQQPQQQQQQQTAPALGSSLFNTGAGAATARPSLFSTSTAQPVVNTFGASTPMPGMGTNALGGASTTGGANNAPALIQPTGAYFDSLLEKNKKRAQGETVAGELPSLQLGLGDLRQKLRKLGPSGGTGAGRVVDGKAHYLLAASGVDPGLAVKDLGSFGLQARAERLATLGAAGAAEVDVDTYLNNLQKKTTLSMIADGLDRSVRDFDNFLEDNVTMEWDAQRKRIYEHFGIKPREAEVGAGRASGGTPARDSQGGFGRSKRKPSSQAPNDRPSQRASLLGRSGLMRSVIGPPSQIGSHASEFTDVEPRKDAAGGLKGAASSLDDRLLREKQGRLADKVRDLNNARLQGQPICIFHELADIETKSGDRHQLVKAYQGMMEVVGENPDQEEAPRGRQFARYYLDPNPQSQNALTMRHKILLGAQRFLEKKFFSELDALIAKHPIDANLGGRPDVVSKIKAFVRLKLAHKTLAKDNTTGLQLANGEYIWAIVYFLLRAGFVAEAAQYVNTNESLFRSMDRAFLGYINSYASSEDRRLKRQMQDRCANEYNQRVRNSPEGSVDPYRMACYKIIGRCDLSNRSLDDTLMPDVYDWYWLQFALARESDKTLELAGESFGLLELQASVKEIGLKHFPKSPSDEKEQKLDFGMAFYLQLLAGMYEQAVAYLYQFSYVDAVHFAIALSYYGLLRPADVQGSNELLSHNTRGAPQINFGQMLGYYTRDFRAANSAAAVDYLVLICLNADDSTGGQQQAQLCHAALRELVLETREYSRLIGDVRPDGRRIKGVVEERGPLIALGHESDFIRAITLQAASFADDSGRTTDAVLLYHLAGDYDSVVSIVSRALSEAISLEIGEDPIRLEPVMPRTNGQEAERGSSLSLAAIDDPVELAGTMMSMYERDHMFWQNIRDQNRLACKVLLKMSEIKGLVAEGRWPECLDKIKELKILPLAAGGDPNTIRQYASSFSGLAQPVAINVPNLIMWTIICCTKQRERLMSGQFSGNESTAKMMIDELKQMSVDLTTYTSQLKYRLPPHLHEALARASAE